MDLVGPVCGKQQERGKTQEAALSRPEREAGAGQSAGEDQGGVDIEGNENSYGGESHGIPRKGGERMPVDEREEAAGGAACGARAARDAVKGAARKGEPGEGP